MKTIFGLIGAGGHGREIIAMLRLVLQKKIEAGLIELIFVVEPKFLSANQINGYRVITLDEFCKLPNPKQFNVAIADSKVRQRLATHCLNHGIQPFSMVANGAIILEQNIIGRGCMISSQTIVTSNTQIGQFFHANCQCNIAHDCVIGDFVTFAPAVKCNGNVVIGDHVYIGAGALVGRGGTGEPLVIGEGAVVGMGAVVTKNVAPYTTVVGNPARTLEK